MGKMANNSKEHIEASSGDLTVKDVDKLLGLFRQLEDLLNPKLPPKNQKLWGQCLNVGQRKFDEQIKQRKAQFTARPGKSVLPKKTSKIKQRQGQRLRQDRVLAIAEKSYCEKDPNYAEAINAAKRAVLEVVKKIDHTLYPVREPLLKFDRARGTLLEADFNQIRKLYKFVVKDSLQCQVGEVIDSLETIRGKVERQRVDAEKIVEKEPQVYIELNLAERTLVVGTDEYRVSSEKVWDFLKTLVSNEKIGRITPRMDDVNDWKNAVDTLRRKIGKDCLRQVVHFSKDGYFLVPSIKIKYGSQIMIRRTRQRVNYP